MNTFNKTNYKYVYKLWRLFGVTGKGNDIIKSEEVRIIDVVGLCESGMVSPDFPQLYPANNSDVKVPLIYQFVVLSTDIFPNTPISCFFLSVNQDTTNVFTVSATDIATNTTIEAQKITVITKKTDNTGNYS